MKKHTLMFAFFGLCLWNCTGQQVIAYRHSGDFSQHFVYLSTNIAISKVTQTEAFGEAKTYYAFGKSRYAGAPELARFTGDEFDKTVESNPTRAGLSDDGKWILVEGKTFDESSAQYRRIFHLISVESSREWSGNDLDALVANVKGGPVSAKSIRTEAVGVFFDRLLVTFLESRSRK